MGVSNNANGYSQDAVNAYRGVQMPTIADQLLNLSSYQNAGKLNPTLEALVQQNPNAMADISTDPRLQQAQMSALQQLSAIGQTGMTPAEASALQQGYNEAQGAAQAKNAQIMQDMAQRGMGGSGEELAARLMAAQGASNQASTNTSNILQQAQARALQALAASGNMAQSQQAQQFGQQAQIAQAQNAINQFNAQNAQNVNAANMAAQNQAQQYNVQNAQQIANANTQVQNQQQQYNKQLQQQQFNDQMALAGGKAGALNNAAQQANYSAQTAGQQQANMINATVGLVGAGAKAAGA